MVKVKVCGITRSEDAFAAAELGAEFLGFNFWPQSPRAIRPDHAQKVIAELKAGIKIAGVFVNQPLEQVNEIAKSLRLDFVQLHGDESQQYCRQVKAPVIKALRLGSEQDLAPIDSYTEVLWLIDSRTKSFGGSGIRPDWGLAKKARDRIGQIILAGGLTPANVQAAIKAVSPWAVDVASGAESSPGIKDQDKLKKFFQAVKNAAG